MLRMTGTPRCGAADAAPHNCFYGVLYNQQITFIKRVLQEDNMVKFNEIFSRKAYVNALGEVHRKIDNLSYENRGRAIGLAVGFFGTNAAIQIQNGNLVTAVGAVGLDLIFAHLMVTELAMGTSRKSWRDR